MRQPPLCRRHLARQFLRWGWLVGLSSLAILLSACSPGLAALQTTVASDTEYWLSADRPIGQSFVATRPGLEGVALWLRPDGSATGEIILRLRPEAGATGDLAVARLPLSAIQQSGYQRFEFPAQPDSGGRYYYLLLELAGAGRVGVGTGPVESYFEGVLYQEHVPVEGQMTLQLVYGTASTVTWLVRAALFGASLLAGLFLLYVVPGWALLAWFWPGPPLDWAETLICGACLTLASYPLLLLWTHLVGLHLGPGYAWAPVIAGLLALAARYRSRRRVATDAAPTARPTRPSSRVWPNLALLALTVLLMAGRLLMVRNLEMPMGGDSVQHTVIIQRVLESGGLFTSWAPYAEARTLTTQFGYHAAVAAWAWFTGMDAPQAVLWAGQLLNGLAVLALYPLGHRLKGPWAGVGAVLVAGFLTQFPSFYTNWGRYPQMTGQVILPVAAWWLWVMLQAPNPRRWFLVAGGAVLVAGMTLTYYRMAFHYAAFVAAALVLLRPFAMLLQRRNWLAFGGMALLALVLIAPWVVAAQAAHPGGAQGGVALAQARYILAWRQLQVHSLAETTVIVASVVVAWWGGLALGLPVLWWWALSALPLLRLTGLPGSEIIEAFTIETSQYIPFALAAGCVAGYAIERLHDAWPRGRAALNAALVVVCLAWGAQRVPALVTSLNRFYDLSTRPDLRAAEWIRGHLPEDAVILINGAVHPDGRSGVATDAGTWLQLLTKRRVTIPPRYAHLLETPSTPGYNAAVNRLVMELATVGVSSPEGHAAVCRFPQPISHAYIGQQRGGVTAGLTQPPAEPILLPDRLRQDPAFRLVYAEDRVMIFEFDRAICAE